MNATADAAKAAVMDFYIHQLIEVAITESIYRLWIVIPSLQLRDRLD